ncbi:MAG: hypothetical protein J6J17_02295 [Bacilli bacterium]|nr:hypothetical protein [Bacilli bacterium]
MNNTVNVAWMYPDILNLHGERANAKAFELISKKMKVKLNIDRIDDIDEKVDFDKYDILLFNPGELRVINALSNILYNQKDQLNKYIKDGKIIFITGTTGALFAKNIQRLDGEVFNGLNILDMDAKERNMVIGDDLYYTFNKMDIMASQIQMIDITLNNVKPFANIKYGYGNNGTSVEGARYKNVIFTNALGPVLVKNPWFTEYLIKLACKNKKMKLKTNKISYDLERKSLASAKEFIDKKLNEK